MKCKVCGCENFWTKVDAWAVVRFDCTIEDGTLYLNKYNKYDVSISSDKCIMPPSCVVCRCCGSEYKAKEAQIKSIALQIMGE